MWHYRPISPAEILGILNARAAAAGVPLWEPKDLPATVSLYTLTKLEGTNEFGNSAEIIT